MIETFACIHCGANHPRSELHEFRGELYCLDCFTDLTVICDDCGQRFFTNEVHQEQDLTLCYTCLDNYAHCHGCGRLIHEDDLHYLNDYDREGYCDSCYAAHNSCQGVENYYYKPEPIFYGEGPRYFGVELEIDEGGESDSRANRLMEIGNQDQPHIYIKHDGSLDDGMEIVTHPMTLDYHMNEMPWADVLSEAIHMGYLSHKSCTAGLHVHVNRSAFGDNQWEQEEVIARILFFVENHWNELLRFSRRTLDQMEQWASRYGRKDDPKAVLDNAKKNHYQRYKCVNLTNHSTIEFRMFRGTLKLNTLLATLQMVDRICEVALYLSDQEMQCLTWTDFVSGCKSPELVQYLKERRLYVNEPVAAAEEV